MAIAGLMAVMAPVPSWPATMKSMAAAAAGGAAVAAKARAGEFQAREGRGSMRSQSQSQ